MTKREKDMLIKVFFFETKKSIYFYNLKDLSGFLINFKGDIWSFKTERIY